MKFLLCVVLLPLPVIVLQVVFDLTGVVAYQAYKITFIVPPLIYCYVNRIHVLRDVLKFRNWRKGIVFALLLGGVAVAIFWGVYYTFGDQLLDKQSIAEKINTQFGVNATTIMLLAPFTIMLNSLLEEAFYRGFSFGLLVRKNKPLGYLLPASVFTVHHVFFIYHWMTLLPLLIAVAGLFVLAIVLQWMYAKYETIVAPWVVHLFGDLAMMSIAVTLLI